MAGTASISEINEVVASRDLRRPFEIGLLVLHGERRGRTYQGSKRLLNLRENVRKELRTDAPCADPYELTEDERLRKASLEEPRLPGV
jgi:pyocin large subunit-like protein